MNEEEQEWKALKQLVEHQHALNSYVYQYKKQLSI